MNRSDKFLVLSVFLVGIVSLALAWSPLLETATFRFSLILSAAFAFWSAYFLFRRISSNSEPFAKALGRYFTTTATVVFSFGILLLLLNVFLDVALKVTQRVYPRLGIQHFQYYGDRVYAPYAELGLSPKDVDRLLIECFQRPLLYDSFTQFRERPFSGRFVNVHAMGFRDLGNNAPWPPSPASLNIFVFGGSTTFGYGLPDNQTIPAHLQRLIDAVPTHRPVVVYNFAAGFYFSTQERILFEKLILDGQRPDIVVFIDGLNELGRPDGDPALTHDIREMMERRVASKKFFLADLGGVLQNMPIRAPLQRAFDYVKSSVEPKARADGGPSRAEHGKRSDPAKGDQTAEPSLAETGTAILDRYTANQRIIRAVASEFGIHAVFVWQPIPSYKYDLSYHQFQKSSSLAGSPTQRTFEAIYRAMAGRINSASPAPDFLYLADVQAGRRESFYLDEVHYTAAFGEEIARNILGHIRHRNLLPQ